MRRAGGFHSTAPEPHESTPAAPARGPTARPSGPSDFAPHVPRLLKRLLTKLPIKKTKTLFLQFLR